LIREYWRIVGEPHSNGLESGLKSAIEEISGGATGSERKDDWGGLEED
jgi:hypothetical protein